MKNFYKNSLFGFLFLLIISNFSCSGKTGNPLLDATDGQFITLMHSPSVDCLTFLVTGDSSQLEKYSLSLKDKEAKMENCPDRVRQDAAFIGIPNAVTRDHITDFRVKERYLALKKK